MIKYVALLRAVNVGGTGKLPMAELREACQAAGLSSVATYIASGNLVFQSNQTEQQITTLLDDILQSQFHLSGGRVILRNTEHLSHVIRANPFADAAQARPKFLHVHFLAQRPQADAEVKLTSYKGPERMRLLGQALYIDYVDGAGRSGLTGRFLEVALGSLGTARNWNTCLKLLEMCQNIETGAARED